MSNLEQSIKKLDLTFDKRVAPYPLPRNEVSKSKLVIL